jgi:cell division protein FtsB
MDLRVGQFPKIRRLPRPETSLRALVQKAPEAEAFAERLMQRHRPALVWLYEARRRVATGVVAVFTIWLFVHVMFGANGMVIYRQKRAEYQDLQKEINQLQQENDLYNAQIKALKSDPKTIEKEAREQLHYTRPGEVMYVAPTPTPQQPPASATARK